LEGASVGDDDGDCEVEGEVVVDDDEEVGLLHDQPCTLLA
jgi:hypothetical protein